MSIEAPARESSLRPEQAPPLPAVELRSVSKVFAGRRRSVSALRDVSLAVAPGEVVGMVGPSGCGKSTLLEIVSGLEPPSEGDVAVEQRHDARERLSRCVLMPQRDLLLPWRSAIDNAALACELRGVRRSGARERARRLFERFGLAEFERARPYELSGGMRQRVAFVRTLLAGKPVLLLDEPFASLDSISRAEMQEWLADALAAEQRTVVLVTHDIEEALFLCDRVLVLSARPGTVRAELAVPEPRRRPRTQTVTSARFTTLRQRALEALR